MNSTQISKKNLKPNLWDGGKTYEYLIFPYGSSYSDKNFLFRISTATIEKTPSVFTQFKNYQRFLIMLDNNLSLIRNSKTEIYQKNEIFIFDSNDYIESSSLGNDFNLMVRKENTKTKCQILSSSFVSNKSFLFVFALQQATINIHSQEKHLHVGDLLFIENIPREEICFSTDVNVIFIEIETE